MVLLFYLAESKQILAKNKMAEKLAQLLVISKLIDLDNEKNEKEARSKTSNGLKQDSLMVVRMKILNLFWGISENN